MTRSTGDVDDGPDTGGTTAAGTGVAAFSDAICGVERSASGASAAAAGFLSFCFQPFKPRRPNPFSLSSSTTSTGVMLRREAGVGIFSASRQFETSGARGGYLTRATRCLISKGLHAHLLPTVKLRVRAPISSRERTLALSVALPRVASLAADVTGSPPAALRPRCPPYTTPNARRRRSRLAGSRRARRRTGR